MHCTHKIKVYINNKETNLINKASFDNIIIQNSGGRKRFSYYEALQNKRNLSNLRASSKYNEHIHPFYRHPAEPLDFKNN